MILLLKQERPETPIRPKLHKGTQTEPFLHCVTQYIIEHPATVMLLLGLDPMANLTPVMPAAMDYYGRRPSTLEQIAESEGGSCTPSSNASEREKSPTSSFKDADPTPEPKKEESKRQEWKSNNSRRTRHSVCDLSEESERLLARPSLPSTRSLKFNTNS